ncbi:unnamed protein product [Pylaiella littoralis]
MGPVADTVSTGAAFRASSLSDSIDRRRTGHHGTPIANDRSRNATKTDGVRLRLSSPGPRREVYGEVGHQEVYRARNAQTVAAPIDRLPRHHSPTRTMRRGPSSATASRLTSAGACSNVCGNPEVCQKINAADEAVKSSIGKGSGEGGNEAHSATLDLLCGGDNVEEASIMPPSLVAEAERGRLRRWSLQDLVQSADSQSAKIIGGGTFAKVVGTTMANGTAVAVKVMPRWREDLHTQDEFIEREISLLRECGAHPYVVDYLGHVKTASTVFMMMPMSATDLGAMIKGGEPLGEQASQVFMRQLLSVLEFLHSKEIVHRDIKPANLLIGNGPAVGGVSGKTLLLADFGLSKMMPPERKCLTSVLGSKPYMAPELLAEDISQVMYDMKVDMWAVGVVTHELLTCHTPFRPRLVDRELGLGARAATSGSNREHPGKGGQGDLSQHNVEELDDEEYDKLERENICAGRAIFDPLVVGKELRAFLTGLLEVDASKRLSAFEAANHLWLGGPEQAQEVRDAVSATVQVQEAAAKAEKDSSWRAVRRGRRSCRVSKAQPQPDDAAGAGAAAAKGSAVAAAAAAAAAPTPPSDTPGGPGLAR